MEERLRIGAAWESGEWVFTNEIGAPWRPDRPTRTFVHTAQAVGCPRTDVKGLRHAHATALLRSGAHPKVVQERLGHSSISVTMDIYSSVLPGNAARSSRAPRLDNGRLGALSRDVVF